MGSTVSEGQMVSAEWPVSPVEHYRSGAVGAGVFLVLLGATIMVARTAPGVSAWTLWPLAIVAAGVVQIVIPGPRRGWRVERVFDGLGTVLIGLILLGNTTGYIGWEMWLVALSLWPVLLVAAGIGLIGRAAGQTWMRALAPAVIWAALLFAVSAAWTGASVPGNLFVLLGLQ